MGPDANDPRFTPASGPRLALLEEEVDATLRPGHAAVTLAQVPNAIPVFQYLQEFVETVDSGEPIVGIIHTHRPAMQAASRSASRASAPRRCNRRSSARVRDAPCSAGPRGSRSCRRYSVLA